MPPQLRLIENEDTGEQGLWNPETQSLFDPSKYRVIQHEESGQQAAFDPTSQSIVAYLPSRAEPLERESPPVEAPTIIPERPVEDAGRAGTTSYKPPIADGGRYRTGGELKLGGMIRGAVTGPMGDVVQGALETAACPVETAAGMAGGMAVATARPLAAGAAN